MLVPCSDQEDHQGVRRNLGQSERLALHLGGHPVSNPSTGEVLHLVASQRTRAHPMRFAPTHSYTLLPHIHKFRLARRGWKSEEVWRRWKLLTFCLLLHCQVGRCSGLSKLRPHLTRVQPGVYPLQICKKSEGLLQLSNSSHLLCGGCCPLPGRTSLLLGTPEEAPP